MKHGHIAQPSTTEGAKQESDAKTPKKQGSIHKEPFVVNAGNWYAKVYGGKKT